MLRRASAVCVAVCVSSSLYAQTDVIMINQQKLDNAMNGKVPDIVARTPYCHLSELTRNMTSSPSAEVVKAVKSNKMQKRNLTNEEIYARLVRSTYIFGRYYRCPDCGNMHVQSMATAFAVSDGGVMATNYHVLESIINHARDSVRSDSAFFVADIDGNVYPMVGIHAYSRGNDIALFQVDTQGRKFTPVPLGNTAPTGSHVHIVAHPGEMYYIYTDGVVTRNTTSQGRRRSGSMDRMEVSAGYAVGASGGAIVDDCGNMVGMVSSTYTLYSNPDRNNHTDPQMVVKTTIPVSCLKQLLGN